MGMGTNISKRRLRFIITSLVMFLVIPCAYLNMDSFQIYRLLQIKENNETQLFKNTSARMQNTLQTSKLKDTRRVGKEKDETQIFKNTSARMQNTLQTSKPKDTRSVTKEKDEKQIFKNTSAKMQNTLQTSKPKYTRRVTTEKDQTQIFQNTLARMQNILKERRQARNREDSCDVETALLRNRSVKEFGTSSVGFSVNRTAIGGSDWSFKTSISCPSNFLQEKKKKRQNVQKCDAEYGKLEHLERINDSFPLFGSRDNCIRKKINTFCKTDLVVPNIVHYIWFGNLKFDFIYFVSMYSAFKHQKPCVIFVYYDILPSGKYWTLLLDVVPNIILVNVTSPSEISGRKIIYVQHKSDILRLLILKE
nr:uncharacterized protein LOC111109675 isoform X2 [Crassostrea virginica]